MNRQRLTRSSRMQLTRRVWNAEQWAGKMYTDGVLVAGRLGRDASAKPRIRGIDRPVRAGCGRRGHRPAFRPPSYEGPHSRTHGSESSTARHERPGAGKAYKRRKKPITPGSAGDRTLGGAYSPSLKKRQHTVSTASGTATLRKPDLAGARTPPWNLRDTWWTACAAVTDFFCPATEVPG